MVLLMELLEALRIIRNQKKIVIPLLIIAFLAAGIMVTRMDTTYQTSGTITLLNSNLESTDNPYLRFDQSLQTTAAVLGDTVSSEDARSSYEEKGLSSTYTVEVPYDPTRTTLLPMLTVTVNADSPEVATATRDQLLNDIKDTLTQKQTEAGAPPETWIQAFSLANNNVISGSGSKARTFLIVFGLGAGLAIVVAFIVDGFKRGVRNTRRGETITLEPPITEKTTDSATDNPTETIAAESASATKTKKPPQRTRAPRTSSERPSAAKKVRPAPNKSTTTDTTLPQ